MREGERDRGRERRGGREGAKSGRRESSLRNDRSLETDTQCTQIDRLVHR